MPDGAAGDISAWSALIGHCFRPKSTYKRTLTQPSSGDNRIDYGRRRQRHSQDFFSSAKSSKMTSSASTQQPISVNKGDDSKVPKVSIGEDEGTGDPPPKKPIWLVAWIRDQIKTFNPLLLIMAIKYLPSTTLLIC